MGAGACLEGGFLQSLGWSGRVVQGRGCCGGGGNVVVYELGYCGWGDVVDESEGGEEEDGCWTVVWWVGVMGGKGHVGGGEHEFLLDAVTVS